MSSTECSSLTWPKHVQEKFVPWEGRELEYVVMFLQESGVPKAAVTDQQVTKLTAYVAFFIKACKKGR